MIHNSILTCGYYHYCCNRLSRCWSCCSFCWYLYNHCDLLSEDIVLRAVSMLFASCYGFLSVMVLLSPSLLSCMITRENHHCYVLCTCCVSDGDNVEVCDEDCEVQGNGSDCGGGDGYGIHHDFYDTVTRRLWARASELGFRAT